MVGASACGWRDNKALTWPGCHQPGRGAQADPESGVGQRNKHLLSLVRRSAVLAPPGRADPCGHKQVPRQHGPIRTELALGSKAPGAITIRGRALIVTDYW